METEINHKNIFYEGAVDPDFIALILRKHQARRDIGAHSIFLGQVRADGARDAQVIAIDFSSYEHLALKEMSRIRERMIKKYALTCLHVYHSTGRVAAGEICLFILTSAPHRDAATAGCSAVLEEIKNKLPIWGREQFSDNSFRWKRQNKAETA